MSLAHVGGLFRWCPWKAFSDSGQLAPDGVINDLASETRRHGGGALLGLYMFFRDRRVKEREERGVKEE